MDCGAVGKLISEMGEKATQNLAPLSSAQPDESLLKAGDQAYGKGDFAEAIDRYDEFLAMVPDHSMALSNKGACLAGLGRFEDAIALRCGPSQPTRCGPGNLP